MTIKNVRRPKFNLRISFVKDDIFYYLKMKHDKIRLIINGGDVVRIIN